jgi:hypothetical protein
MPLASGYPMPSEALARGYCVILQRYLREGCPLAWKWITFILLPLENPKFKITPLRKVIFF